VLERNFGDHQVDLRFVHLSIFPEVGRRGGIESLDLRQTAILFAAVVSIG